MSLLEFQTSLGRAIRDASGPKPTSEQDLAWAEPAPFATLIESRGFRFTVKVQRSWNRARARNGARLTLSVLPRDQRRKLLDDWLEEGGGTAYFFAAEADSFLEFIAKKLPDPSHALTICRLEQATLRASEGSRYFTPPDLSRLDQDCRLCRGRYAGIVRFHAQPALLLAALTSGPAPPVSPCPVVMLFGPAFAGLSREASDDEVRLWERLKEPAVFVTLLHEGYPRATIESLVSSGCLEP